MERMFANKQQAPTEKTLMVEDTFLTSGIPKFPNSTILVTCETH
jgi:hypothetical protein